MQFHIFYLFITMSTINMFAFIVIFYYLFFLSFCMIVIAYLLSVLCLHKYFIFIGSLQRLGNRLAKNDQISDDPVTLEIL